MRDWGKISAAIFLALLTVVCFDATADLWPTVGVQKDVCAHVSSLPEADAKVYSDAIKKAYKVACEFRETPLVRVNVEGMRMVLSPDQGLLAIVALFALMGGALNSLMALGVTLGRPGRATSPLWLCIAPFAALAFTMIFYVAVRAVILPQGNLESIDPYGYLAMAGIAGFVSAFVMLHLTSRGKG